MSSRQYRRPYARQRKESDAGEEDGFLYCLMYYFDEARRESEEGADKKARRHRKCFQEDDEEEDKKEKLRKLKEEQEDDEMLNPLVYREHIGGRNFRGGMPPMHRRAFTPDREPGSSSSSSRYSTPHKSRAHSQPPPEINHNDYIPQKRYRRKKK